MYRGPIKKNGNVTARFSADDTNSGSASMTTTSGPESGSPSSKTVVITPAGANQTTMSLGPDGIYRIVVDMKEESDDGRLTVVVDGKERDADNIKGDTRWTYSVE